MKIIINVKGIDGDIWRDIKILAIRRGQTLSTLLGGLLKRELEREEEESK